MAPVPPRSSVKSSTLYAPGITPDSLFSTLSGER
jgi:hypothetical protein